MNYLEVTVSLSHVDADLQSIFKFFGKVQIFIYISIIFLFGTVNSQEVQFKII